MKKIFTLLAIALLTATATSAQPKAGFVAQKAATNSIAPTTVAKAKAAQKKIELATGERLMGFYDTDDLPSVIYEGYGYLGAVNNPQTLKAANLFEPEMISGFAGGKITKIRFAIADAETTVYNVFVCEFDGLNKIDGYNDDVVKAEYTLPEDYELQVGWNDVELPEEQYVDIQEGKYYAVGYCYEQTSSNKPIVTDMDLDLDEYTPELDYGFLFYGNLSEQYGIDWYGNDSDQGHLCVQAVVKGGGFADLDVTLADFTSDLYARPGSELNYSFSLRNYGNLDAESYKVELSIGGETVETLDTPISPLTASYQTYSGQLTLPENITSSATGYTLRAEVTEINGEAVSGELDDNAAETTFIVYDQSVERQMHLIEQFTSVLCGYCPRGHDLIEEMQENNPGKYAWVAHHVLGMGTDPMAVPTTYMNYFSGTEITYYEYFLSISGYPMASFDRCILNDGGIPGSDAISFVISWVGEEIDLAAELIDQAVDKAYAAIPAFVSVDLDASYSYSDNKLDITVSGSGVDIAKGLLNEDVLYVFLLEDGLIYDQEDYDATGGWQYGYTHNNVLRRPVSGVTGDVIGWTSDSSYKNTYSISIDSGWTPANLKIVAFIAGPMLRYSGINAYWTTQETAFVNNCNMLALAETAGINGVAADNNESLTEVARYAADGTMLAAPTKGINLVKMSDGSVRKIVIK